MLAIVLGSGLNDLVEHVEIDKTISYESFTDFDIAALEGHDRIIYEAKLDNTSFIILSGKLHLYEGYTYEQSIAPLQYVSNNYKITKWIITSASGGLSSKATIGQWQKVTSIMTLENITRLSSSTKCYTAKEKYTVTYAYQKGPALGTVAEYKMLCNFGADLVGMSMLPELIFLNSINSSLLLYSLPVCSYHPLNYNISEPSHKQVIQIANQAISQLLTILSPLIPVS